ncbi:LuxR C-terminal-related transcriptional regulator [Paraburkholderia xenovorans]|uniref:helix-turn-helix transcriptional regulator n=1 Tax=Paraburkholderia xenovorans TaxID=36873 RepID=UPI0038B9D586
MNDVVAHESISKSGRSQPGAPSPCVSSEAGALHVIAAARLPVGVCVAEIPWMARHGGARVGIGFAKLRLDIERAWQSAMRVDCHEALVIADLIEHQATRLSASAAKALRCEIAALRAVAFVLQDDEAAALAAAWSARGAHATATTAHVALTVCRSVYWRLGDLESFYAVERFKPGHQPTRRQTVSTLFDLGLDAAVALDQMHFGAARLLAAHALERGRCLVGTHPLADTFPVCVIAQVLYEQGQVDEAEALLVARIAGIRECCTVESALRAHGLLARIAASRGQHGRALVILSEAEALGVRRRWPRLRAASLAHQVEIEAGCGRVEQAANCLQRLAELADESRAASSNVRVEIARFHTVAEVRLALAHSPCAGNVDVDVDVDAVRQVHRDMVRRGRLYAAVAVELLLVDALLASGQRDEALERLVGVLRRAPVVGLHQTLVDCSARVAELIDAIVQRRIVAPGDIGELLPYARMLRQHRRDVSEANEPFAIRRPNVGAGITERERLIVALMGRGLSNKQIAVELGIAPETVKSHAKHLYTKLSVRNRTEAVALATRLGLLHAPRSSAV